MNYLIKNTTWKINKDYIKEKLLYLLIDRPDEILYQSLYWYNNKNQFHRNYDLPSYIWDYGVFWWYKNNQLHREDDKPAVIYINGEKEYHSYGKLIKK